MTKSVILLMMILVVPYVGTWIEMSMFDRIISESYVVPYVGTWIEMLEVIKNMSHHLGRSLRGNVDRNLLLLLLFPIKNKSFPTWERG